MHKDPRHALWRHCYEHEGSVYLLLLSDPLQHWCLGCGCASLPTGGTWSSPAQMCLGSPTSHLPTASASSLALLETCSPCQRQCKGWDPPSWSNQLCHKVSPRMASPCGVWEAVCMGACSRPTGLYPQQGFSLFLAPCWDRAPLPGAGRKMKREDLPHCKDAPRDGQRQPGPALPP